MAALLRQPTRMQENEVYQAIGEDGFHRLTAAFYRQIPGDGILGPMYSRGDLTGAEQRLREFLIFRFGGPPRYIENRGHPRLRMRHAPFAISLGARDRWMLLMTRAIEEVSLTAEASRMLLDFFSSTATFLVNRTDEGGDPTASPRSAGPPDRPALP